MHFSYNILLIMNHRVQNASTALPVPGRKKRIEQGDVIIAQGLVGTGFEADFQAHADKQG